MARQRGRNERYFTIMLKSGGRCWYCGKRIWPESPDPRGTTIDHFVAQACGGTDEIDNLVPACGRCNTLKGDGTIEEFRHHAALLAATMPGFTRAQIAWLRHQHFDLRRYDGFRFWFETHKTRHTSLWSDVRLRQEVKRLRGAPSAL